MIDFHFKITDKTKVKKIQVKFEQFRCDFTFDLAPLLCNIGFSSRIIYSVDPEHTTGDLSRFFRVHKLKVRKKFGCTMHTGFFTVMNTQKKGTF